MTLIFRRTYYRILFLTHVYRKIYMERLSDLYNNLLIMSIKRVHDSPADEWPVAASIYLGNNCLVFMSIPLTSRDDGRGNTWPLIPNQYARQCQISHYLEKAIVPKKLVYSGLCLHMGKYKRVQSFLMVLVHCARSSRSLNLYKMHRLIIPFIYD